MLNVLPAVVGCGCGHGHVLRSDIKVEDVVNAYEERYWVTTSKAMSLYLKVANGVDGESNIILDLELE